MENWYVELPENAQKSLKFVKFILGNMEREVKTSESGHKPFYRNPDIALFATGLVELVERDFLYPKINADKKAVRADGEAYLILSGKKDI